jgi:hypothetical protein
MLKKKESTKSAAEWTMNMETDYAMIFHVFTVPLQLL